MTHPSRPQECLTGDPTRVSYKSVPQEFPTRCPTRVFYKSVPQECPTRVSRKSVPQEFPTRVTHKSVPQECPTRVSFGHMQLFERVCIRVRGLHLVFSHRQLTSSLLFVYRHLMNLKALQTLRVSLLFSYIEVYMQLYACMLPLLYINVSHCLRVSQTWTSWLWFSTTPDNRLTSVPNPSRFTCTASIPPLSAFYAQCTRTITHSLQQPFAAWHCLSKTSFHKPCRMMSNVPF